jgi:putative salt-induced outer membrane protein YdiY
MNIQARILAAALAGLLGAAARADQAKVDNKEAWHGSIALGLSVAAGNNDSTLVNAGFKADRTRKADEWHLTLDGGYGKTDGDVATEILHGAAQYRQTMDDRWFWTAVADGLHDGVAGVEYRLTLGPGAGYYFIKSDATRLSAEVGPSYVWERVRVVNPQIPPPPPSNDDRVSRQDNDYLAARAGERFEHKFSDKARLWQQTEWLPQVDDFENYLLITEVGAEAALNTQLSLRVVGTHRYDNFTPDDRRHYDMTLVTSLVYKF